jgi:hypothetical protein
MSCFAFIELCLTDWKNLCIPQDCITWPNDCSKRRFFDLNCLIVCFSPKKQKIVNDFLVFHQGTGFVFEEVPDFWAVFEAVPILSSEEISENAERLNLEVMEEDDSSSTSEMMLVCELGSFDCSCRIQHSFSCKEHFAPRKQHGEQCFEECSSSCFKGGLLVVCWMFADRFFFAGRRKSQHDTSICQGILDRRSNSNSRSNRKKRFALKAKRKVFFNVFQKGTRNSTRDIPGARESDAASTQTAIAAAAASPAAPSLVVTQEWVEK